MFFKDFVSVKRQKIKRGASQTYDTPSWWYSFPKSFTFAYRKPTIWQLYGRLEIKKRDPNTHFFM